MNSLQASVLVSQGLNALFTSSYEEYQLFQQRLNKACQNASRSDFDILLALASEVLAQVAPEANDLLDVGSALFQFGFLSKAKECFLLCNKITPERIGPRLNLANVASESGDHKQAGRIYSELLHQHPNSPVLRRNALVSLEYNPESSAAERKAAAENWGRWAIQVAGGARPRPAMIRAQNDADHRLRIGYVSADFCQHTVGLFLLDVIKTHDSQRVEVFTYSANSLEDWVTDSVRQCSKFRRVDSLDDIALARQIRKDKIDVLVDLSGHTSGSRLLVFAHRPAPVQVSWLGYCPSTGLTTIDAVLLDEWHAPPTLENEYSEKIIRLPHGRLCYSPVPFAPAVAAVPCIKRGYVTFGSFNNSAKYNTDVFTLWSRVLKEVPGSRLLLKWRNYQDVELRNRTINYFADNGIEANRIELRGPSFHAEMLREYADIDIALDPFPFSGGMTSCEALWMGVPLVTMPQSRAVSRQSHAFLSQIALADLSAGNREEYIKIAKGLSEDKERLQKLRATLRESMQKSSLMNVKGFTRSLEDSYQKLFYSIHDQEFTSEIIHPKTHHQRDSVAQKAKLTIDGKSYDIESLSEEARSQINSIQACDTEIQRLSSQLAITQTAKTVFVAQLKHILETCEADENLE